MKQNSTCRKTKKMDQFPFNKHYVTLKYYKCLQHLHSKVQEYTFFFKKNLSVLRNTVIFQYVCILRDYILCSQES